MYDEALKVPFSSNKAQISFDQAKLMKTFRELSRVEVNESRKPHKATATVKKHIERKKGSKKFVTTVTSARNEEGAEKKVVKGKI